MTEDMNRKRNREGADPQPANPGESPLATAEGSSGEVAAPKHCGRTKQELMGLMEKVYQQKVGYDMYFFKNRDATGKGVRFHRTNLDEEIDRCLRCGLCIDEHNPAAVETGPPPSVPLMTWLHKHDCLGRGVKLSARTAVPLDPPESVRR